MPDLLTYFMGIFEQTTIACFDYIAASVVALLPHGCHFHATNVTIPQICWFDADGYRYLCLTKL